MKSAIALKSSPCRFIVSRRSLMIASLSCATPMAAPKPITAAIAAPTMLAFAIPLITFSRLSSYRTGRPAPAFARMIRMPPHCRLHDSVKLLPSGHRTRDMGAETGSLAQSPVPSRQPRYRRALDGIDVPTMDEDAERDVGQGEGLAGNVVAALQLTLDHGPELGAALFRRFHGGRVLFFRRQAIEAEQQRPHRLRERCDLPVHPALYDAARRGILGMQPLPAARRREMAHDGVGFPNDEAAIINRGHEPIGIHREIGGILVAAELPTPIDALEGDAEFLAGPQDLLHIG